MIEVRKLQLIGRSSYMVSLPKEWIKANTLDQGDEMTLEVEDKFIIIYPKGFKEEIKISKVEIEKLPKYDDGFLKRYIYALYIQGIDEIVIKDENLDAKLVGKISNIVKTLIGMEIIDASDKVVLRCLTVTDFDVYGVVRRMTQIVDVMMRILSETLLKDGGEIIRDIQNLEVDSDRLYLLAVRQEHRLVREYSSPAKWNELRLILGIRTVAKLIEEILDSFYNLSTYVTKIINIKEKEMILGYIEMLREIFKTVSKAYFNSDLEASEDSIELLEKIEEDILGNLNGSQNYRLSLETLAQICRHMKSIAEIAFNKAVRESLIKKVK